jgi:hypothetical protein
MTMNKHPRILSISDDDGLRLSRMLLLSKNGYDIESMSASEVLLVAEFGSFDAVLMCRSVEPGMAAAIAEKLREHNPEIKILRINPTEGAEELCRFDLEVKSGPCALLDAARAICDPVYKDSERMSLHS